MEGLGMTFQAYLDSIKEKTGKTPEDFRVLAEQKGLLKDGVKAGPVFLEPGDDRACLDTVLEQAFLFGQHSEVFWSLSGFFFDAIEICLKCHTVPPCESSQQGLSDR